MPGKKAVRSKLSDKRKSALFAFSWNQCAFPGCTRNLVELPTTESPETIIGEICHIYPVSERGPRGNFKREVKDVNCFNNLILLCRDHHRLVDSRPETYPPKVLQEWKSKHQLKIKNRIEVNQIESDLFEFGPKEFVNQRINDELEIIRNTIWFPEFNTVAKATQLGLQIFEKGTLSSGSSQVRSKALAQCSRHLSLENRELAIQFLEFAKDLNENFHTQLANICMFAKEDNLESVAKKLIKFDKPEARTLSLIILSRRSDKRNVLDWFKLNIQDLSQLDSDGRMQIIQILQELELWDDALTLVDKLQEDDFINTPALYYAAALTQIVSATPRHLQQLVSNQLPFTRTDFNSLKRDSISMELRQLAKSNFQKFYEFAHLIKLPFTAERAEAYALWLELENSSTKLIGLERLRNLIENSEPSSFKLMSMGIAYGIINELELVENRLNQHVGELTFNMISSHIALAVNQKTEIQKVNYITKYKELLLRYYPWQFIECLYIEVLSRAGFIVEAESHLKKQIEKGLSNAEAEHIADIIQISSNLNSADQLKSNYEKEPNLTKLEALVLKLSKEQRWEELEDYGKRYYESSQNDKSAELFVRALFELGKYERVVSFIKNQDFQEDIPNIKSLYCWSLYFLGELSKTKEVLTKIKNYESYPYFRKLFVDLHIALGEWKSISEFLIKCRNKNLIINSGELLGLAKLSIYIESNLEMEFLSRAVEQSENDQFILTEAYIIAALASKEHEIEPQHWIKQASKLSGKFSSLKKPNMRELFELNSEFVSFQNDLEKMATRGEIPLFVFANARNETLTHLMLYSAFMNQKSEDIRNHGLIPAFSGSCHFKSNLTSESVVCFDISSLLTLSNLGKLEEVLNSFSKVYIAHSTLNWIFHERNKIQFHQPSRIKEAKFLKELADKNKLNYLDKTTSIDRDLIELVGRIRANLVTASTESNNQNSDQKLVVIPAPVYKRGLDFNEVVNMDKYYPILCGCLPIIKILRKKGYLSRQQFEQAEIFLRIEQPWPENPIIENNAILYIDGLALSYFLHISNLLNINLLEKIVDCGYQIHVDEASIFSAESLIEYGTNTIDVSSKLENLMNLLSKYISDGKVLVGKVLSPSSEPSSAILEKHPSNNLFTEIENCDTFIVDDRFYNRLQKISEGDSTSEIATTYHILKYLRESGKLNDEDFYDLKFQLRQMGYTFVPIEFEELQFLFNESIIDEDGTFIESAELKAIRNNILAVRMRNWINIPEEATWLMTMLHSFYFLLPTIWNTDKSEKFKTGCSNWLLAQTWLQSWSHVFESRTLEEHKDSQCKLISMLLTNYQPGISEEKQREYWRWLSTQLLIPLKEADLVMYDKLLDSCQEFITFILSNKVDESNISKDRGNQ